ncbi:MAG: ABC transporter ATP-binding protein [Oscillospiraceae bacterium]|nr:ABC transporter ATP-binding protein [Oscillospiraceae bacterium]
MKTAKTVLAAFKEMQRLEKRLIPACLTVAVIGAVSPFVNIKFTSVIIDLLDSGAGMKKLALYIAAAVGINFLLFFINSFLGDMFFMYRSMLYNRELQSVASKLYSVEFKKTEDSGFKELLHKHSEAQNRVFSAFSQFSWMLRDFVSGFITLLISLVFIFPLFKIGLTKMGESFFEKPVFLLSIFAAIAVMAAIILVVALKMNKQWFLASDEYSRLDRLFYFFLEKFKDYKTGKDFRLYREQELIEKIATESLLNDGEKVLRKASMNSAKSSSFVALLGSLVGFGIYLFIGIKGLLGSFSLGSLVLYCGSFMQVISGIMKMAAPFGKTAEMVPLVNYYFEIINTKDDMPYGERTLDDADEIEIEFKNVSFTYPGSSKKALDNISLTIQNGEHLAVVGRNGSGKTTFIKLLCRLYDPDEGEILINGVNIKQYTKESLLKLFAPVFQDFSVFAFSVAENLCASDEYDSEKLNCALDEADILKRVRKMSQKEKTFLFKSLDKNGVDISGGEQQKIALARALYKDSPVVILDEPTAALDPIAENEIYSRFHSFTKDKTAVYISHRLSSCVFCDRVAVFDKAKLVETGTHKKLLDKGGKYAELWNAQAQYYC